MMLFKKKCKVDNCKDPAKKSCKIEYIEPISMKKKREKVFLCDKHYDDLHDGHPVSLSCLGYTQPIVKVSMQIPFKDIRDKVL
jgi:hypothetical protein